MLLRFKLNRDRAIESFSQGQAFDKSPHSLRSLEKVLPAKKGAILLISGKRTLWVFHEHMAVMPINLPRAALASRIPEYLLASPTPASHSIMKASKLL